METPDVIFKQRIDSQEDMRKVEMEIMRQLGGEKRQCAFLRSQSYITLRLAAVYPTLAGLEEKAPLTAYSTRFSLTVTFEGGKGWVTMRKFDDLEYHDGAEEDENPPEREAKRRAM